MLQKLNLFLLSFASFLVLTSSNCKDAIKTPTYIGTKNTKIENIGIQNASISTNLEYNNANNFGISVKDADLKIFLEDEYMADAEQIKEITVGKNANFLFPVMAKFNPIKMVGMAMKFIGKKQIKYKITGYVKIGKAGVFIKVPVSVEDVYAMNK